MNNNSYNNNGYSNNSVNAASSGMTEVALVPAAAVADRPRLSCASLRYPPCDPPEDCGDVVDGNAAGGGAGGGAGADASQINLGQQLAWLIQHLRSRSRCKQVSPLPHTNNMYLLIANESLSLRCTIAVSLYRCTIAALSLHYRCSIAALSLFYRCTIAVLSLFYRYKQELRVVWSDEYGSVDSERLGTRLVEDR